MGVKERLLEYINNQGVSVFAFERKCGLSNGYVSSISKGIGQTKLESIMRNFPSLNRDWLLYGEGAMLKETDKPVQQSNGLPLIPIDAVAGFPTADNDAAALADCQRYVVPEFNTKGANFLIRVSGDSMMPMFHNGDIIACRKISDVLFFQWGEVYVLDTSQGVLVKRVRECQADEACITCESENERYGSFRLPKSDIRSLSTIVGLIRIM